MSEHVVAIVQARLGSSRFPRKVLADIAGRPLILHVMERAAAIPGVHTVIAAVGDGDDELVDVLRRAGYSAYEGPTLNVLKRYALAAAASAADVIVRVTGDCPLFAPEIGGQVLEQTLTQASSYYVSAIAADGVTDGLDVEAMRRWILDTADREATNATDREHVTPWIRRHTLRRHANNPPLVPYKLSVDTTDDLLLVRRIYEQLPPKRFAMTDTLIAAARAGVWEFAEATT